MDDFVIESNGQCFICLDQAEGNYQLLQNLSQYLKLDRKKSFSDDATVPPALLLKVERSRLKVKLCKNCSFLNEKLSKLIDQLEKIKMEVEFYLGNVSKKLDQNSSQVTEANVVVEDKLMRAKLEIMSKLRMEMKEKCSHKLNSNSDSDDEYRSRIRVSIKKLSNKQITDLTINRSQNSSNNASETTANSAKTDNFINVKVKSEIIENYLDEDDDFETISNHFDDDHDHTFNQPSTSTIKTTTGTPVKMEDNFKQLFSKIKKAPKININSKQKNLSKTERKKYVLDPETGLYSCKSCCKQYKSLGSLYQHRNIIHKDEVDASLTCTICKVRFKRENLFRLHQSLGCKGGKEIDLLLPERSINFSNSIQLVAESIIKGK